MSANLAALAERSDINSLVELINSSETNSDGSTRLDAYRIQEYYSRMTLDKIKISQDNYVFLKYGKTYSIPKGNEKWTIRKDFPLTEHTVPLIEGVPPQSDKTRKDKISGTFHQYGRYMEFSDRVDFKLLDPILMEYSYEYGDVAVRTMHRLARKEMLNSTNVSFANNKTSKGALVIGDYVGLSDFRLMALKMKRLAVKAIGSVYKVITSEEHYWDLMKDPLIVEYIGANNGLSHYKTGQLPELFGISFEKTMMDDYSYGYELGNPGEYLDTDLSIKCRAYLGFTNGEIYNNIAAASHRTVYVAAEYAGDSSFLSGNKSRLHEELPDYPEVASGFNADGTPSGYNSGYGAASEAQNRLSDGSWIPMRTKWVFTADEIAAITTFTTKPTAAVTDKTQLDSSAIYYTFAITSAKGAEAKGKGKFTLYYGYDSTGNGSVDSYETIGVSDELEAGVVNEYPILTKAVINGILPTPKQVPIHTAIMIGQDALARLEIQGEGNVRVYVKEKGSAGVLDPINQRQSIGFKINTIGFKRIREEAIALFHHVPTQAAATAGISLS